VRLNVTHGTSWKATGRMRYRSGDERVGLFRSKRVVILEIQETRIEWTSPAPPPPGAPEGWTPSDASPVSRWRDASPADFMNVDFLKAVDGFIR
jgi:hypothetical protein